MKRFARKTDSREKVDVRYRLPGVEDLKAHFIVAEDSSCGELLRGRS